jgi:hypothetical protein
VLGALAAGCGGSSSPDAASTPGAQTGFEAYTACLSRNGVTLPQASRSPGQRGPDASGRPTARPSGGFGGGQGGSGGGFGGGGFGGGGFLGTQAPNGVDQAKWDQARQACASVLPTAGPGRGVNNSALTAYRNCLSEHGVTASAGPNRLNTADPTVASAIQACEPLRPTEQPRPTPSPAS